MTYVVFGTGPVGLAVIDVLSSRGDAVRAVNNSGRASLPPGVEQLAGDAADPSFAARACEGAASVFFCLNPPYTKWPELFPPLQEAVVSGAASAGARLVALENLYMYGPTGGRPLTEDLPYKATTRKGLVRAQMSRDLVAADRTGRVRVAIGRASDYFGPRGLDSALGARVFDAALAGKPAQVMGKPDLPHSYTYLPDIGRALATLADHDEAFGKIWHLPSPVAISTRSFVTKVYAAAGHTPKLRAAPKLLVQALGLVNPMMRELAEMTYEFEEPFIVNDAKIRNAFGVEATPLEEAIPRTVEWFRARGPRT